MFTFGRHHPLVSREGLPSKDIWSFLFLWVICGEKVVSLEDQSCLSSFDESDNEKDSERERGLVSVGAGGCYPPHPHTPKDMSQQHIHPASMARYCCLKVVFMVLKILEHCFPLQTVRRLEKIHQSSNIIGGKVSGIHSECSRAPWHSIATACTTQPS